MTKPRIAVIEDDEDLRRLMALVLGEEGYDVSDFASARDALRALEDGGTADLILLDLMMPDMNGWEFCEQRAASAKISRVPVIVVTARRDITRPTGVSDILHKPFDVVDLMRAIGRTTAGARLDNVESE